MALTLLYTLISCISGDNKASLSETGNLAMEIRRLGNFAFENF